jgi:hypothetical protein
MKIAYHFPREPLMPKPPPLAFASYPPETSEKIVVIVQRAARGRSIDQHQLIDDILSALYSAGVAHDGSEEALAFREAMSTPGHKALAAGFGKLAEAANPLDPRVCTEELRPRLNAAIHSRWSGRWRKQERGPLRVAPARALGRPQRT